MTDEALMAAYQDGDLNAFTLLLDRHEKPLWHFLRRYVGDSATAEDLLQEVFLRVVEHAHKWTPGTRFKPWLYTIARNLSTDHARRMDHRRAVSLEARAGDGTDGGGGDDSGPLPLDRVAGGGPTSEEALLNKETATQMDMAIASLPQAQREVFLMREVMELSFAEIAQAVGANEATVKSRMRYALEHLRKMLGDLQPGSEVARVA